MNMKKTLRTPMSLGLATVALTAAFSSCVKNKSVSETVSAEELKTSLVVYYSQTGATEQVANLIQQKVDADIEKLELVNPYDGDFGATIARCQEEMKSGQMPELKALTHPIADYDTLYIGYPVWFGTYAMPIESFLKANKLDGKVIIPFCTFGSGGLNTSTDNMKKVLTNAKILDGYGVRNARVSKASDELDRFLIVSGIKEGEVEALPEFSAQVPVNANDKAIFDEACSSYQMPLGTPETAGHRSIKEGTEYLFTVSMKTEDGSTQNAQIYVIKGSAEGAVAEFTQVVR